MTRMVERHFMSHHGLVMNRLWMPYWLSQMKGSTHVINGMTPLLSAVQSGSFDTVKTFLAKPAIDVNKNDKNGRTPLHVASWTGHRQIVDALLAKSDEGINACDINDDTTFFCYT